MADKLTSSGLLAGRFLLSGIFLMSGTMKILHWSVTADSMKTEGMVAVPFFLFMAMLVEISGGLAILLGYYARPAALMLAMFLVPVTLTFHHFWTYEGRDRENQMQHFAKNVTIIGGLVTLAAAGAGGFSLDGRAKGKSAKRKSASASVAAGKAPPPSSSKEPVPPI